MCRDEMYDMMSQMKTMIDHDQEMCAACSSTTRRHPRALSGCRVLVAGRGFVPDDMPWDGGNLQSWHVLCPLTEATTEIRAGAASWSFITPDIQATAASVSGRGTQGQRGWQLSSIDPTWLQAWCCTLSSYASIVKCSMRTAVSQTLKVDNACRDHSLRNANTGWGSKEDSSARWEHDKHHDAPKSHACGMCYAFQKGECNRGASCKFSHDEQRNANPCWSSRDGESSRSEQYGDRDSRSRHDDRRAEGRDRYRRDKSPERSRGERQRNDDRYSQGREERSERRKYDVEHDDIDRKRYDKDSARHERRG